LSDKSPLLKPVSLGFKDLLKVSLTAKEGGRAKRPHQAFLIIKETDTGLEAPFPLTLKDSGKGIVEIVCVAVLDYMITIFAKAQFRPKSISLLSSYYR
jgi:hypothetical protein